jgi:hypothetical protein
MRDASAPSENRLQNWQRRVHFPPRSEFLKVRRWSLGFRRWTWNRTRQGKPGAWRKLRFKIFELRLPGRSQHPIANRKSTFEN